jgi:hypothetical protein
MFGFGRNGLPSSVLKFVAVLLLHGTTAAQDGFLFGAVPSSSQAQTSDAEPKEGAAVPDRDERLKAVESSLKQLTAAEEKRSEDAQKRPSFQLGGQL